LIFGSGGTTINDGTSFSGSGSVSIPSNATFRGAFSSTNLSLGNVTGDNAVSSGAVKWGGTLTGSWLIATGTWSVQGISPRTLNNASVTNDGTISWQSDSGLYLQNNSTLVNRGVFEFQKGAGFGSGLNSGPISTLDNRGTIRVAPALNASIGGLDPGTINFVSNAGTIDVGAGGSFTLGSMGIQTINVGNMTINAGSQFLGAGAAIVNSNVTFNGAFNSTSLSLRGGTYTGNDVTI